LVQRRHLPADAIGQAAKLLKDHMAIFINFEEVADATEEPAERAMSQMNEVLQRSVKTRTQRSFLQLPEERQHPDHSATWFRRRSRDAAHQEFRRKSSERDQGNLWAAWASASV
jgi:hypothetical protein